MGSTNVEEVTCTVIGGVTYNQVCTTDSKLRTAEDEDSMTGVLHSELALLPLVVTQNAYRVQTDTRLLLYVGLFLGGGEPGGYLRCPKTRRVISNTTQNHVQ